MRMYNCGYHHPHAEETTHRSIYINLIATIVPTNLFESITNLLIFGCLSPYRQGTNLQIKHHFARRSNWNTNTISYHFTTIPKSNGKWSVMEVWGTGAGLNHKEHNITHLTHLKTNKIHILWLWYLTGIVFFNGVWKRRDCEIVFQIGKVIKMIFKLFI